MMNWNNRILYEKALVWQEPKRDGLGGVSWGEPVEVLSKWEYKTTIRFDERGSQVQSNATLWTFHDIKQGYYVWKGTKELSSDYMHPSPDFEYTAQEIWLKTYGFGADPRDLAAEVIQVDLVRSLIDRSEQVLRKVYLR